MHGRVRVDCIAFIHSHAKNTHHLSNPFYDTIISSMSEDLTKTVVVKRPGKKKSGYLVEENNGDYVISEVPAKARVNVGDKVVRINGIDASEFIDEDDANALIESIRIKVVPEANLEEFDEAGGDEESEEEGFEEYDRNAARSKPKGSRGAAPVPVPVNGGAGKSIYHCNYCDHDNEDLSEDEDGDLVCEECGHVIEPPTDQIDGGGVELTCKQCGHLNKNCERDEDGDYVCEECGYTIPEDTPTALVESEEPQPEDDDGRDAYTCPDCGHVTVGPEPDEEGDRICEECGCILPEKVIVACIDCGHENLDPVPDEEGDCVCTQCGAILIMEDQAQEEAPPPEPVSKPKSSKEPKKTGGPADMFNPGDVITVTVGKSNPKQDAGLKVEQQQNGKFYVRKVPSSGLFAKTPVIPGDKILEINGQDYHEFKTEKEIKKIIKDEMRITLVVLRKDPDDSDSSASSVDSDDIQEEDEYDDQYVEDSQALVVRDDESE